MKQELPELQYTTINDIKSHLPEIIDRIDIYKTLASIASNMIECIQDFILLEIRYDVSFGEMTTTENYQKQVCDFIDYSSRARYWDEKIKKIKKVLDN